MYTISKRTAVPQILINGEMIIGFNEPLLRQKLGIGAIPPPTTSQIPATTPMTPPPMTAAQGHTGGLTMTGSI